MYRFFLSSFHNINQRLIINKVILIIHILIFFLLFLFLSVQLYEINDDPKRKEFLDDLFSYMQKRGKLIYFYLHLINTCSSQLTTNNIKKKK